MIIVAGTDLTDKFTRVLGDELRRARKARGWTRQHLLDHLDDDISLQTLATYELGTRKITVARLVCICRALDTTAQDILERTHIRVFKDRDTALGWAVDLHAATRLRATNLVPLRRWATIRLGELPNDQPKTAWLTQPALDSLATLCGLDPKDLLKRLTRSDAMHRPELPARAVPTAIPATPARGPDKANRAGLRGRKAVQDYAEDL